MTTINASEATIRATAAAIGRAALFDDKITDGDKGRIAAWAEALEPHKLQAAEILGAVTSYYQSNENGRAIQVSDIIRQGRAARREMAEREQADRDRRAEREAQRDERLGIATAGFTQLPINTDGKPVDAANDAGDAITRDCPRCKAPADHYCTNPVTTCSSRIPCLARMKEGPGA